MTKIAVFVKGAFEKIVQVETRHSFSWIQGYRDACTGFSVDGDAYDLSTLDERVDMLIFEGQEEWTKALTAAGERVSEDTHP